MADRYAHLKPNRQKTKSAIPAETAGMVNTKRAVIHDSNHWVRFALTAELVSDAHLGSGTGGGGVDSLVARDRENRPVIWASHVEGVLRDAARRLGSDQEAEAFFGRAGGDYARGDRQRAIFTSLYAKDNPESHIWRSTAREAFDNRAPKDDTLRVIECIPRGTMFRGEVELPQDQLETLQRLIQEVDALGSGRANGSGRVKLSLGEAGSTTTTRPDSGQISKRLTLLLHARDPLCVTATATPDNMIPSLAFIPGRALLGAIAAWLLSEGHRDVAKLLTEGKVSIGDGLPLPEVPEDLDAAEVLPAPLTLQSEKPETQGIDEPWWAQTPQPTIRKNAWDTHAKLKRPPDDLFIYRSKPTDAWKTFRPGRRVRLRNGRPDPKQADTSLFAIEQIVEKTSFLAELQGSEENMRALVTALSPVLTGQRWLRVGRAGAPVEVKRVVWKGQPRTTKVQGQGPKKAIMVLTSDLLLRDEYLRWRTALAPEALREMPGEDIEIIEAMQDTTPVHGFNGTSRLWRMPAVAIRRGSVYLVSGDAVAKLATRAATGQWLGERTHEGFGRFRLDEVLPGVSPPVDEATTEIVANDHAAVEEDEEAIAAKTRAWHIAHMSLAERGGGRDRKPSLSQWLDLVGELEANTANALKSRLDPTTAGGKSWKHCGAKAILKELEKIQAPQRKLYARRFVRWLRADMRKGAR